MTDQNVTSGVAVTAALVESRARPLRAQRLANRIIRVVLRTPLLCRLAGKRLVTLHVVGRKSGRRYVIPVAYTRHGDVLLVGTPAAWSRNLRTGQPMSIRLKGRLRTADVEVLADEAGVVAGYDIITRDNHQFAKFNSVGFDASGAPDQGDLHLAWAAGARVLRLTSRIIRLYRPRGRWPSSARPSPWPRRQNGHAEEAR
jgi:hypothetical protein